MLQVAKTQTPQDIFLNLCTPQHMDGLVQELVPQFQSEVSKIQTDYSADFRCGNKGSDECGFYWDTNMGIRLHGDGFPIACIGFIPFRNALTIAQLQGIMFPKVYPAIRWERLLVRLLVELTTISGQYPLVQIMRPYKIEWYNEPQGYTEMSLEELQEHKARMHRRYDGTARSLKFTLVDGFWELPVKAGSS